MKAHLADKMSDVKVVVKHFHRVFVFYLNRRISGLLTLGLSFFLLPSQPELQRFRKTQQQKKSFAQNANKRKRNDGRVLIGMHQCFCSDCENASGCWQHGITVQLIWPDIRREELWSGCLPEKKNTQTKKTTELLHSDEFKWTLHKRAAD